MVNRETPLAMVKVGTPFRSVLTSLPRTEVVSRCVHRVSDGQCGEMEKVLRWGNRFGACNPLVPPGYCGVLTSTNDTTQLKLS